MSVVAFIVKVFPALETHSGVLCVRGGQPSTCSEASEPQDVRISGENVSALSHLVVILKGAHQVDQIIPMNEQDQENEKFLS